MARWAVEARIFNSGKTVAKIRKAEEDEQDYRNETRSCDVYVDVFEDYDEAREFLAEYRRA